MSKFLLIAGCLALACMCQSQTVSFQAMVGSATLFTSLHTGARIGYKLPKNFEIGFDYQLSRERYTLLAKQDCEGCRSIAIISGVPSAIDPSFVDVNGVLIDETSFGDEFDYFSSLQLYGSYFQNLGKRWIGQISIGAGYSIWHGRAFVYSTRPIDFPDIPEIEPGATIVGYDKFVNWYFDTSANLAVHYKVSEFTSIGLEQTARGVLTNFYPNALYTSFFIRTTIDL